MRARFGWDGPPGRCRARWPAILGLVAGLAAATATAAERGPEETPAPPVREDVGVELLGEPVLIGGETFYPGLFRLGGEPGLWLFRDMDGLAVTDGDIALGPFPVVLGRQKALRHALRSPAFALATLPGSFARWPDGEVPFTFEGDLFSHEIPVGRRQPILNAMATYEALTPVRFREKTAADQSWVRFARTWDLAVCPTSSAGAVGRVNGATNIYIQLTDCTAGMARSDDDIERSALHEISHALGFKHEHTRSDRDDFIEIDFDCINQNPISAGIALLGNYNIISDDFDAIGPYAFRLGHALPEQCPAG
ncbi:MAG: M12 family metallopeptidase [Arhodomonas sp.]|nr:M12 family metallopeptidase [Arhodomonas sp.]